MACTVMASACSFIAMLLASHNLLPLPQVRAKEVGTATAGAGGRLAAAGNTGSAQLPGSWHSSNHTNNWAVLVCTSRFWFNYRHMANALSIYHTMKHLGIPDSNIILMLADDMACNPRNPKPAAVFNNRARALNLYGKHVEVDYRGYEVTVENFLRVLTGRHRDAVPLSKRLMSDSGSNVVVMLTGHGGDEFMKFQDDEELMAQDLADALAQMHEQRRYNELLLLVETCEASTMWKRVYSPRVMGMASSILGEKSYSHHSSPELGLSVIDRFTYYLLQFFEEEIDKSGRSTMQELFNYVKDKPLDSTAAFFTKLFPRDPSKVLVSEFFGSVTEAIPTTEFYDFIGGTKATIGVKEGSPVSRHHDPTASQTLSGTSWAPLTSAADASELGSTTHSWQMSSEELGFAAAMMLLLAVLAVAAQPRLERLSGVQ